MSEGLKSRPLAVWRPILLVLSLSALLALSFSLRQTLREATTHLANLSVLALASLPLFAVWTVVATMGWRTVMVTARAAHISLLRLCLVRLQAQAVNLTLPLGGLGGEALRASALGRSTREGVQSAASVSLDAAAETISCFLFSGAGALLGWQSMRCTWGLRLIAVLGPWVLALLVWALPTLLPRLLVWPRCSRWHPVLSKLADSLNQCQPGRFARAVAWHCLERALMAVEIWLYAQALGLGLSYLHACVATAMMTIFSSLLFFIPGQAGVADGGIALGLLWAGVPWAGGLAVALTRRCRQLLVAAVGLLILATESVGSGGPVTPTPSLPGDERLEV